LIFYLPYTLATWNVLRFNINKVLSSNLCSKTYYCFGVEDKFSCKGINKRLNDINKSTYMDVLLTKRSGSGTNRGFRSVDNTVCTYLQQRAGISYFYPKRKVLEHEVYTTPLHIQICGVDCDIDSMDCVNIFHVSWIFNRILMWSVKVCFFIFFLVKFFCEIFTFLLPVKFKVLAHFENKGNL
jgi:hypothetical protein